jgi:uncharacterized protein YccT (UPF0319 family)
LALKGEIYISSPSVRLFEGQQTDLRTSLPRFEVEKVCLPTPAKSEQWILSPPFVLGW